jgi:dUTP pyrophosphatase
MSLYIYAEDPELRAKYQEYVSNRRTTDSGVDLFITGKTMVQCDMTSKINLGIIVGARTYLGNTAPCLLLPRSSISKTPLRLANSLGLIDSGYRGQVCAVVDNTDATDCILEKHDRLFQICAHDFLPFLRVIVVDKKEDLPSPPDDRGSGGFGSTGR